ncbi:hypothetical protein [Streptomyces acidiscabies]|uniref:Uncharacterized protein n=1 Tax=Streptomyces acidiscabies TaxID=42234 RepID=A0A0L0KKG5_9ACTN|nr:hypothetical protein [Streptomyces acidiscabies]KND38321.1 hypothetical protein IQ63_08165 [Streptomyces acidiscabies]
MSERISASRTPRSERLVGTPVIRRGSQWWLVTGSGSILATDPTFTGELDRFASAMAAADQAVAEVRAQQRASRDGRRKGKR